LYLSAKLLRDLYKTIVRFEDEPEYIEEVEMDPELERLEKILETNVNELELSVRCSNCLSAAKIETIGELVSKNENEMLKYRNFGKKSLEEINALLEKYELHLGMNVDEILQNIVEAKNKVTIKKG
jgi:DNA-directed RNA polymerase subunit alpha